MRVRNFAVLAAAVITIPMGVALTSAASAADPGFPGPDGAGPWADTVAAVVAKPRIDGSAVPATRNDPRRALGVAEDTNAEGTFASTGFGGSLTLGFTNNVCDGGAADLDIDIHEVTFDPPDPNYPAETYLVEVAKAVGGPYVAVGTVNRDARLEIPGTAGIYHFVRVTDKSSRALFEGRAGTPADGVDIDGIKALKTDCAPPAFTCRASAAKAGLPIVGTLEPVIANNPDNPCKTAAASLITTKGTPLAPAISADLVNASTTSSPGGVPGGESYSSVANAALAQIGLTADVVESKAKVACSGAAPVLTSSSKLVNARLGSVLLDGNAQLTLVTPVGTLYINKTITAATSVTQRAIWLDVTPALELLGIKDVIVSQSAAGYTTSVYGNSCSA